MRQKLRDNSLSVVMFGLFVLFLLGHSLAGYAATTTTSRPISNPPSATRPIS